MVRLYTWGPTTAEAVLEHTVAPDVGHAALEVLGIEGGASTYASFWPERESLIERVRSLWKPRPARSPGSYAQESDPDDAYMQRPADGVDIFEGLDENLIAPLWQRLRESEYDFFQWNCASVCKMLLLSAMPSRLHPALLKAGYRSEDVARLADAEDLAEEIKRLSASPFIDSHPEELRRIAEAYLAATAD